MPKIVDAPAPGDLPGLPRLNNSEESKSFLRVGEAKWQKIKGQIACVRLGSRDFYTDEALLKFVREQTIRPAGRASPAPTGGQPTPSTRRRGSSWRSAMTAPTDDDATSTNGGKRVPGDTRGSDGVDQAHPPVGCAMTAAERRELRMLAQGLDLIFERADADDPTLYGFGHFGPDGPVFLFTSSDVAALRRWAHRRAVDQHGPAHQHARGVP